MTETEELDYLRRLVVRFRHAHYHAEPYGTESAVPFYSLNTSCGCGEPRSLAHEQVALAELDEVQRELCRVGRELVAADPGLQAWTSK